MIAARIRLSTKFRFTSALFLVAAAVPITVPRLRPFDAAAIPTVGFFV
jgi:hypothetical protein